MTSTMTSAMTTFLCDTNVWLALTLSRHVHQATASRWLDTVEDEASVLFCRATQQSFLGLLTNHAVLGAYGNKPLTNARAWATYEALLGDERIVMRSEEPPGLEAALSRFAVRETSSPKLWMDAYLAAFAVGGGHRLITTDRAFGQFADVDVLLLPN